MTKRKTTALCVPLIEAEPVRRRLRQQHLLQEDVMPFKDRKCIYFPIKKTPTDVTGFNIVTRSFEIRPKKTHCYKDLLTFPKDLQGKLPTSYDIIGEIILIKLPKNLVRYRTRIGEALLEVHKNIQTVCRIDAVSGELRTRNIEIIAGKNHTVTTHTEYGVSFEVDVATTYFSPRLASERKRVAELVKPGETVVDMFAGVAPFSIMIARFARPRRVYAIDKNTEAVILAKRNVTHNRVLDIVEVIQADAKDAARIIPENADRIIMNLPFSAHMFFQTALSLAASVCVIHYYDMLTEADIPKRIAELKKIATGQGYDLTNVSIHNIKSYTPREFYIGLDITATKHADVA